MAKVNSIIKLSGTITDVTFVNSKAYGAHARAKRGTYTPVTLAEGMKKSGAVQTEVNQIAKIIFDAVNAFVPGFKDGKFWTRILSLFRKQQKAGRAYSYQDFDLMEMRWDYPTSKLGYFMLAKASAPLVQLHYQVADEKVYRIRLLRIVNDITLLTTESTEVLSVDTVLDTTSGVIPFEFSEVSADANVLYALHCEELMGGKPAGLLKCQGLRFFG